jgi:hypothetical protein
MCLEITACTEQGPQLNLINVTCASAPRLELCE